MLTARRTNSQRDPLLTRVGCLTLVLLAFGFGLMCASLEWLVMLTNMPQHFGVASLLATVFTVPYAALLMIVDRNEREPLWLMALTFAWGALVATSVSILFNTGAGMVFGAAMPPWIVDQLTASLSAPPVEETSKALALLVVVVAFRHHFDNVLDGMLYGALVGLGFAWFENISYYMMVGGEGGIVAMLKLTYIRGFLNGIASHVAWTALTGVGFGLWRVMRRGWLRWLMPPLFWMIAMFAHFAWNSFAGIVLVLSSETEVQSLLIGAPLAVALLQLPFVLLLALVVLLSLRHEDRMIRRYLEHEADDVLPQALRGRLVPARRRIVHGASRLLSSGPLGWMRGRRQDRLLIELAFAKWHHARSSHTWEVDDDDDVSRLRTSLRSLSVRR